MAFKIKFVSSQPLNTCITPLLEFHLAPHFQDVLALNLPTTLALYLNIGVHVLGWCRDKDTGIKMFIIFYYSVEDLYCFQNCDMSGCDLQEANLRGANLKGAALKLMLNPLHMAQTVR